MKQTFFFFFTLFLYIQSAAAQNNADYNSKGDQSLARLDYLDACMWYGEGIEKCDSYSIRQLTKIWNEQPSVRTSIHVMMSKSLNCLGKKAVSNDTESMLMLSEYYDKGIGTDINHSQSELWKKKVLGSYLEETSPETKKPVIDTIRFIETVNPEIKRKAFYADFEFFLMYSPSFTMPSGLTVGVLNDGKLGGYLSFKSNLRLQPIGLECTNTSIPNPRDDSYYDWIDEEEAWNNYMLTAGIVYPIVRNLSASLGLGYAKRDVFWRATQYDLVTDKETASDWYHNTQSSYNGVTLELGAIYRYNHFIFSGGCNTVAFKDIDVYAGIGYVF